MCPCKHCMSEVRFPCHQGHTIDDHKTSKRIIIVACDTELQRKSHYLRMAIASANLGYSRREFIFQAAETLYNYKGLLLWPEGPQFQLRDSAFEEAFADDWDFRWLSDFFKVRQQPIRRPQQRLVPRLRLIDTYFQIKHPKISRHFYR